MATTTEPSVPAPLGAFKVGRWPTADEPFMGEDRDFWGKSWLIKAGGWQKRDIEVYIHGIQSPDGSAYRVICAGEVHPDNPISPEQARALGEALIAAADEYETTAVNDKPAPQPRGDEE